MNFDDLKNKRLEIINKETSKLVSFSTCQCTFIKNNSLIYKIQIDLGLIKKKYTKGTDGTDRPNKKCREKRLFFLRSQNIPR